MISDEKIEQMVVGIANSYAKDKVNGHKWDKYKFEEYRQELFLEAYTLLNKNKDMDVNYMAKCLWNKAGELFNVNTRIATKEQYTGEFSIDHEDEYMSTEVANAVSAYANMAYENGEADEKITTLVNTVLKFVEGADEQVKTFIIAKLKLNGYLPLSAFPEVNVNPEEFTNIETSENHKLLKDLFDMKYPGHGGTNKFKNGKRKLFIELIKEFELEDSYLKWYKVEFLSQDGSKKVAKVKKYSAEEAKQYVQQLEQVSKFLAVSLDE